MQSAHSEAARERGLWGVPRLGTGHPSQRGPASTQTGDVPGPCSTLQFSARKLSSTACSGGRPVLQAGQGLGRPPCPVCPQPSRDTLDVWPTRRQQQPQSLPEPHRSCQSGPVPEMAPYRHHVPRMGSGPWAGVLIKEPEKSQASSEGISSPEVSVYLPSPFLFQQQMGQEKTGQRPLTAHDSPIWTKYRGGKGTRLHYGQSRPRSSSLGKEDWAGPWGGSTGPGMPSSPTRRSLLAQVFGHCSQPPITTGWAQGHIHCPLQVAEE